MIEDAAGNRACRTLDVTRADFQLEPVSAATGGHRPQRAIEIGLAHRRIEGDVLVREISAEEHAPERKVVDIERHATSFLFAVVANTEAQIGTYPSEIERPDRHACALIEEARIF